MQIVLYNKYIIKTYIISNINPSASHGIELSVYNYSFSQVKKETNLN